jgi:hypothetical protein
MKRNTSSGKTTRTYRNGLFWIIIVAAVVAITVGIVGLGYMQSSGNISVTTTATTVDWISSGPFSINKQDYTSDEKLFFVASGIGYGEKGEAVMERPNGEDALIIPFDGSKSPTINRYFDISSLHDEKCKDCNIGTWKISFQTIGGISHLPITFNVIDNSKETPEIKEEVDK